MNKVCMKAASEEPQQRSQWRTSLGQWCVPGGMKCEGDKTGVGKGGWCLVWPEVPKDTGWRRQWQESRQEREGMCSMSSKGIGLWCYEKKWLRPQSRGVVPSQLCSKANCVDGGGQGSKQDLRQSGGTAVIHRRNREGLPPVGPPGPRWLANPPTVDTAGAAACTVCPGNGFARLPGCSAPRRCIWSLKTWSQDPRLAHVVIRILFPFKL